MTAKKIITAKTRIALKAELEDSLEVTLTILSGKVMSRFDLGDFVIDLAGISWEKDPLTLDYDHNTAEAIGTIGDLKVTEKGLIGDAEIFSTRPDDRAADVIRRLARGTPYECSPMLELDLDSALELTEGETLEVNGETVGNCVVYSKAKLLGVAVCPYGTDDKTGVTAALRKGGSEMDEELKEQQQTEGGGEVETSEASAELAHPELEAMIESFGFSRGVEFYRRGLSMEEAEAEDYAELKAARLKAEEEKPAEEGGEETAAAEEPAPADEEKEELAKLKKSVESLSKRIESLVSLSRRGEPAAVSAAPEMEAKKEKSGNPVMDYAARLKK